MSEKIHWSVQRMWAPQGSWLVSFMAYAYLWPRTLRLGLAHSRHSVKIYWRADRPKKWLSEAERWTAQECLKKKKESDSFPPILNHQTHQNHGNSVNDDDLPIKLKVSLVVTISGLKSNVTAEHMLYLNDRTWSDGWKMSTEGAPGRRPGPHSSLRHQLMVRLSSSMSSAMKNLNLLVQPEKKRWFYFLQLWSTTLLIKILLPYPQGKNW